ncbi:MAG: 1-acyl-sn-glycerol-3-phosphate acyltransferase [Clostridia bacterium]|nr:1-acyl-sn-glycerol-3-phosphate acyltransferase [Clostridia bacterium]
MRKQAHLGSGFTWFVRITGALAALPFFKPKVYCKNKEKQGKKLKKPSILVSNHISLLDFVLYLFVFWRNFVHFQVAEVMFNKSKFMNWLLLKLGCIRVDRNQFDFGFVGDSLELLDKGEIVGIFPSGRLPIDGKPFPFKPSVIFIALRTDAPIIPVYTDGQYGLFKRARVVIGEPIYIRDYCKTEEPDQQELDALTRMLEEKVYALRDCIEERFRK